MRKVLIELTLDPFEQCEDLPPGVTVEKVAEQVRRDDVRDLLGRLIGSDVSARVLPDQERVINPDAPNLPPYAFPMAVPENWSEKQLGMDLRDYFAAKAMHAMWVTHRDERAGDPYGANAWMAVHGGDLHEAVAGIAYLQADEMLKARER